MLPFTGKFNEINEFVLEDLNSVLILSRLKKFSVVFTFLIKALTVQIKADLKKKLY